MNKNLKDLPLRSGVGIVLLNKENKVFVAKRIDNPKNFWQMPQGGVDEGEDNLKAAFRELEEETSIKSVELIKELDGTLTYDLPDRLLGIIWKGKYKGQRQKWFLYEFKGSEKDINIETSHPEFLDFTRVKAKFLAKDKQGQQVFLADSAFSLQMTKDKYPALQFHATSEF